MTAETARDIGGYAWKGERLVYVKDFGGDENFHVVSVDRTGDEPRDFIVIGGYESGIDSAVALSRLNQRVTVLDARPAWNDTTPDPSISLSPYTIQRLKSQLRYDRITLHGDAEITAVSRTDG